MSTSMAVAPEDLGSLESRQSDITVLVGARNTSQRRLFDNLRELERPEAVASVLGISIATIYDWRYRSRQRKVPAGLFVTFNRRLYLRTDILQEWIASQNPQRC